MINGKFVENEVISILEKMAVGNLEELKKNMMVMDDCGNTTGDFCYILASHIPLSYLNEIKIDGMDECDKAAQMLKCCKEKAPDMVSGIIMSLEKSISSELDVNINIL